MVMVMGRSRKFIRVVLVYVTFTVLQTAGFIFSSTYHIHALSPRTSQPDCNFPPNDCDPGDKYRRADGYCNNLDHPAWGSPGWPYRRMLEQHYHDGESEPRSYGKSGNPLPSPREISRTLHTSDSESTRDLKLTSMFTQFGQFLDHDISLTPKTRDPAEIDCCEQEQQFPVRGLYAKPKETANSFMAKSPNRRGSGWVKSLNGIHRRATEKEKHGLQRCCWNANRPLPGTCFPIHMPPGDKHFTSNCMNFVRSKVFAPSFKCPSAIREQGNAITSFIDASQIYGSTMEMQNALKMNEGGWLKMSGPDLLPANTSTTCRSSSVPGKFCFGSGDVRVNEQPMLSALHVVFHRYHNYMASALGVINSHWSAEKIFQESRKIIGATMQRIVYDEYLPLVIGPHFIRAYSLQSNGFFRHDKNADPRVINAFATAAFRFGHSMVPGHLMFGANKRPLESVFFKPQYIQDGDGSDLSSLIKGTISDFSQRNDRFISPTLSQKLFQNGTRSLDLVSLNIQRGRDHGLPPYNNFREACGLPRLTKTKGLNTPFLSVYEDLDDVDLFSGGLGEKHVPGGVVGDTFACIIARQFKDLKFGDRFFYEHLDKTVGFTIAQIQSIKAVHLSSILCEVSDIKESQENVFQPVSDSNPLLPCKDIPKLDVMSWVERR